MKLLRLCLVVVALCLVASTAGAEQPTIRVHKTPTCGCCQGWADYLARKGFEVITEDHRDLSAIRERLGITDPRLMSCHTAEVEGYVVEGHVPADDIHRLLTEKPEVVGITAPGMPTYSPGMASEEPRGYDVLSFDGDGEIDVFSSY